jgi:hypothetical protein
MTNQGKLCHLDSDKNSVTAATQILCADIRVRSHWTQLKSGN